MTVLNVDTRVETLRIVRHLDEGLLGDTYEAFDEELKESFALKVLKREFVEEMEFSDRFLRECQVITQLENDAVAGLDLFGVTKWKHWLRYEYFEGFEVGEITVRTLRDYLQVHPTGIEEEEVVFLTGQILQALKQAHGIGLLHRNLKPSNLMLRRGEDDRLEVKIADFALVRCVGEENFRKLWQPGGEEVQSPEALQEDKTEVDGEDQHESILSPAAETWLFRGPEEHLGKEAEEGADLYAVACMSHLALTGENLPKDREILLSADLNPGWRAWLLRCTEENPAERFADAGEALSQLPRAGTSLRYAEMPFEREGRHVEGLASPYREGVERSTDGAESHLREAHQKQKTLKPWATLSFFLVGISIAFFGFWQIYRSGHPSPATIYKCDGFDDYYSMKFGFFEGEVQWRGTFEGEIRSASGQWNKTEEGYFTLRISLLRRKLPVSDGNTKAFRAVDVVFKKQDPIDERAKEKRYKRWVDVLDYDSGEDRFLLIKRVLRSKEEFFPGRDKEGRVKLFDQEAFAKEEVVEEKIYFVAFDPDSTK